MRSSASGRVVAGAAWTATFFMDHSNLKRGDGRRRCRKLSVLAGRKQSESEAKVQLLPVAAGWRRRGSSFRAAFRIVPMSTAGVDVTPLGRNPGGEIGDGHHVGYNHFEVGG